MGWDELDPAVALNPRITADLTLGEGIGGIQARETGLGRFQAANDALGGDRLDGGSAAGDRADGANEFGASETSFKR